VDKWEAMWNIPNTVAIDGSTYCLEYRKNKNNNVTTAKRNKTVLRFTYLESNTLRANNNNKIEVTHYLKLTEKIDLVGKVTTYSNRG
jgi:hypothetical protein